MAAAQGQIAELEKTVENMKKKLQEPSRLTLADIKDDDTLVRFYTGLPSGQHFDALASYLSDCSSSMPLWRGKSRPGAERRSEHASAAGPRTLLLEDER